jgi:hypothetical protein
MTEQEIKDKVLELNPEITEEQYNLIINKFYRSLRDYVTDPSSTKGGIMLQNWCTLSMNPRKIERLLKKFELKEIEIKNKNAVHKTIGFYKDLLKQLKRYERQAR